MNQILVGLEFMLLEYHFTLKADLLMVWQNRHE
jgi:hypothetical protein